MSEPQAVLDTAKRLLRAGLVEGTSGNVSARLPDGTVCLTPSSLPYETMAIDDLVICDLDGNVVDGERSPTSEKALHLACYRRHPEVGAVIHSHAVHATMFAVLREPIPALIEEVVTYVGGDVPVAEYRMTGSDELGDEVASHLGDRSAVLLASHGMVTVGRDPDEAFHTAAVVERTARIVWGARVLAEAMGTKAHELPAKVNADFAGVYSFVRTTWPRA
ncbi:MAG: class II aldolase/adducin family protein [Acidimicrobiales bacterium]